MRTAEKRVWRRHVLDALRPLERPARPSRRAVVADAVLALVLAAFAVIAVAGLYGHGQGDGAPSSGLVEYLRLRPVPPTAPEAPGMPPPDVVPSASDVVPSAPARPWTSGAAETAPSPAPAGTPRSAETATSPAQTGTARPAETASSPVPTQSALPEEAGVGGPVLVLVALTALPLAARRRYPLTTFWVVVAAALATHQDATWITVLTCVIAVCSAIVHSNHRVPAMAGLVLTAVLAGVTFRNTGLRLPDWSGPFVVLLSAGVLASFVRFWQQQLSAGRRRLAEVRESQAEDMRRAVEVERSRIASELHDVVTHNVSVMVIQAGAARKVMDAAPADSKQALLAVEASGRAAMGELRHVMGLLAGPESARPDAPGDGLEPQPGVERLGALVERVRAAGVPVSVTISPPPGPLPPGVDLAVYRVVQEALTNTIKHAAGAEASVVIGHDDDWLEIEVTDTGGTRAAPSGTGTGRGLIGLRERLAVYDGSLDAGVRTGGGYQIKARVPWRTP
ncbi:sensor histidine kinase [Sphaerisporangium corydalis]|uniref:histidine kinase n=1 Tax=Sphaerisporangium corydalis TaxID=1441875 RepID=A0ABV9ELG6_9ACTN|nr:histidine kinase [Sphaerisporangium corydalis]